MPNNETTIICLHGIYSYFIHRQSIGQLFDDSWWCWMMLDNDDDDTTPITKMNVIMIKTPPPLLSFTRDQFPEAPLYSSCFPFRAKGSPFKKSYPVPPTCHLSTSHSLNTIPTVTAPFPSGLYTAGSTSAVISGQILSQHTILKLMI